MNVIVLGSGKIGSIIGKDFFESNPGTEVTFSDINKERAKQATLAIPGCNWITIDTTDHEAMVSKMKKFDLILGALPGDFGYKALEAAIDAGIDVVDVSFTAENPVDLDGAGKDAGVTIIPDCGIAPGLSNILTGYAVLRFEKVRKVHIMVGGIPEVPVPPLGYTITWSAEGLIDEYVRDVGIIEGGKHIRVPALSGLEKIEFPGVGILEAFYTDGLRTIVDSIPGVDEMWEKTLRYPGHVEKVKLLRDLGFFDDKPVPVSGIEVQPRLVTARLLERTLWNPEIRDLVAMLIEVKGESSGDVRGYRYTLLDRFNQKTQVTAMARTTAYTASIVAGMVSNGMVKGPGVIPPERLGMDHEFIQGLMTELEKRGIMIEETKI
ncbi:MAG: saccharopine dehydrogenase C-terminal domain-containing protein [Candidatus Bathyarchaeota archaeon]|nr:saccharopine dehydrogenase C-terminal domain-containing protein [Candidatus Bathyarchaeota archaeon]